MADTTWIGPVGVSSPFETPSNWSGGAVPTGGSDKAYIDNGGIAGVSTYNDSVLQLLMGSDPGKSGSLVQTGGHVDSLLTLILGDNSTDTATPAGDGTYTMNAGSLTIPDAFIGNHGQGTFIMNGGTITSAAHFRVGRHNGGTGFMNMTGGVLTAASFFLVGENGGGPLTVGTFNISGGTMTCANYNIGQNTNGQGTVHQSGGFTRGINLVLGEVSRQPNLFDLSGGTLRVENTGSSGTVFGGSSNGIGELEVSGTGNAQIDGHIFLGNGTNSIGTFGMSGGTVALGLNKPGGGFMVAGEFGKGTVKVSGGTYSSDYIQMGRRFNSTSQGQGTQTGGNITVRRTMYVGGSSGNDNFYDISAGTLTETNDLSQGTLGDSQGGLHVARFSVDPGTGTITTGYSKGRLTVSGSAVVNIAGGLYNSTGFHRVGNGTSTTDADLPGGNGLIEMKGGTLSAGSFLNGGAANGGSFNNGGAQANYNQTGGVATVGAVTGTGNVNVSAGTMNVNSIGQSSLTVSGGKINVAPNGTAAGTSNVKSLTMSGAGQMDLSNNALVVDYTGPTSPAAQIRGYLKSGYAGGAWNGPGLNSSTANASQATDSKTALGYAEASAITPPAIFGTVDSDAVLVRHTLYGDGDLSGKVDLTDFTFLAANFNGTNKNWLQGDYNYDDKVDLTDFTFLAANFNKSVPASGVGSPVPEPASLSALALLVAGAMARRARRGAR